MATDNILYVNTASIAVGTITDASGVGLVPSASHALFADSVVSASHAVASDTSVSSSHALIADTALSYMEQPRFKSGLVAGATFEGSPMTASVAFATAFDDTDYSVVLSGGNARSFTVEDVTAAGFIISTNSNQAVDEPVYWLAMEHGESD